MKPCSTAQRRLLGLLVWMALLVASMTPTPSAAQAVSDNGTRAAARELAERGIDAYQAGNYVEATEKLDKAFRLFPTPTIALWSARACMQLVHWVEAAERYRDALQASTAIGDRATQAQAQMDAQDELAKLSPRIPAITLELHGPVATSVKLTIDGSAVSSELVGVRLPVNPGLHRVVALGPADSAEVPVQIAEREHKQVPLHLLDAPALPRPAELTGLAPATPKLQLELLPSAHPPDTARSITSPLRTLAVISFAVGAASLAVSGVTALLANGKCSGGLCDSTSDQDTYDPLRTAATLTFWGGAALVVGGGVLFWAAPSANVDTHKALGVRVSPLRLDVWGAL